jgi:hypothetical protein
MVARREYTVLSRNYFARRAATLLKFAQTVKDPILSAVLVEKASDLKEQADEIPLPPDLNPKAPDIEDSVQ